MANIIEYAEAKNIVTFYISGNIFKL